MKGEFVDSPRKGAKLFTEILVFMFLIGKDVLNGSKFTGCLKIWIGSKG